MMAKILEKAALTATLTLFLSAGAFAQKYTGIVDRAAAVIGNELILVSDVESEVQMLRTKGYGSDRNVRCEVLEKMMEQKLFLIQSRIDSLTVNQDMVESNLSQQIDQIRTALGGDEQVEEYFHKPLYKLRSEWRKQFEDQSLIQQEQQEVVKQLPEVTPYDVKVFLDSTDENDLPVVPQMYQLSQICIYPDREAAAIAVKEKLLDIRERIINGEKFSTLARLYSEDPGSARKGGELGMASKSIFWPAFSDAAMSLKPGIISQIVETPDGFHLIEVLDKKGDMFNARHILLKPEYTAADREKAFARLDSLKTMIDTSEISFELAARYYSEDPATRTNGGQMADPNTGSSYFAIDELKPQDYAAIKDLKPGEISEPVESLDNEGRDGNLVYKIIRLDKIVPSHTATFERDYTELRNIVQQKKQVEALESFVDQKIGTTPIMIDPLFGDCDFKRSAWLEKVAK
ncbi:MAG: peptidylprolyl isomerase [Bacteroidales bacterium]|nr:peptidylprolyl isomerase [Bacteroidales bacterium]MCI5482147.1 peptidylprolyl isomerase [Bacteroidales bacterium]MDD6751823.1 peptidylprolyl isomerase [Bacteroidales bacterium]MDY2878997.1 peptidylprolyl isomerase [Candidatus Cryptobacteroides sp.]